MQINFSLDTIVKIKEKSNFGFLKVSYSFHDRFSVMETMGISITFNCFNHIALKASFFKLEMISKTKIAICNFCPCLCLFILKFLTFAPRLRKG